MERFLLRPMLPGMPVHVLDWASTRPPQPGLPFRLDPAQRKALGAFLLHLLQPPLLDHRPGEGLAAEGGDDDDDWPWSSRAPHFVPRRARHPDVGWSLERLVCPDAWERWATEDDPHGWFHPEQELEGGYEGELSGLEHTPHCTTVHHQGGSLEIYADEIRVDDDGYGDGGLELIQAVQGVLGLAVYTDAGLMLHEPVECAVCRYHFTLRGHGREVEGCPACGVEWVEVLP